VRRARPARVVRVPALAWLGGAAPLARRQLTELWRDRRRMVGALGFSLLLNALVVGLPAVATGASPSGERDPGGSLVLLGLILLVPVLTTAPVSLDFRRDLDRMALLRSLPLSPFTVTVGQVFSPVLVIAATQAACVVGLALSTGTVPPRYTAAALLALPPLVWTVAAVENLVFLLLPVRPIVPGTPRAVFPARNYLLAIVKVLALGLTMGFAAACAFVLWIATPGWIAAAVAGGIIGLVLSAAAATWAAAWAFTRFDVSRDIPA
ncbi:MAG: hypothetical protein JWM27_2172, partial [Gemmatimonadetes bacterium]|nr:hypothetical protein [Gemmatimonadota bacterium]